MGEFFDSFKSEAKELLQNKKSLASILILGILILGIPIGMKLVEYQKTLRSRASGDPIEFVASDDVFQKDNTWFTKSKKIALKLTSPLAPAATAAATQTQAPTARPTASSTQAPTASPTAAPTSTALTAPTGLARTCSSDGASAVFSWNAVNGVTSYSLRVNKDPFADWRGPGDIEMLRLTVTTQTVSITPNTNYEWKVSSVAGRSEVDSPLLRFSCPGPTQAPTPASTATSIAPPTLTTGRCALTTTSPIKLRINLSWDPVSGASKYLVRIDDKANGWGGYNKQTGDIIDDNVTATVYVTQEAQAGHSYQAWAHSVDASNRPSGASAKVTFSCP